MRLTFLGTGTSTGVPQLRCQCEVCRSADPRDRRLRCSALVEADDGREILLDCGPDFRQQMLLYHPEGDLDALLITHEHYDHVGGIDDLRPYCRGKKSFPIYCDHRVEHALRTRLPYCFAYNLYPGVPRLALHVVSPGEHFHVGDTPVQALEVVHGKMSILGYKLADRLGYITDASYMPDATFQALRGIDTLVINALRIEPHPTHFSLSQTLQVVRAIAPRQAFLIHLSHDMGLHASVSPRLPDNVHIAHDGLTITL